MEKVFMFVRVFVWCVGSMWCGIVCVCVCGVVST